MWKSERSKWFQLSVAAAAALLTSGVYAADEAAPAPAPAKAAHLPLPVHTIEGGGGGAITPIAYPVNAGPKDEVLGLPAVSYTYLDINDKATHTGAITETLWGKLELGYAFTDLRLGNLDNHLGINQGDFQLHTVEARYQIVEEKQFGEWTPSVMIGTEFKYNDGVSRFNNKLGGALTTLRYDKDWGFDFTVTATKMFANVFGRPLILSAGVRASEGAWTGLAGFTDAYKFSAEANVVYLLTDWLFVGYEYRQMPNALNELGGIVQNESDWHTVDVGLILGEHLTVVGLWGHLGNVVDTDANNAFAIQVKWEF